MGELSSGDTASVREAEDRLDSWKEIAAYLKRDVTTAQRWERREGMPVRRHLHERMGSVYAYRVELDAWARGRHLQAGLENGTGIAASEAAPPPPQVATPASRRRWGLVLLPGLVAAGVGGAVGGGLWLERTEHLWRNPIDNAQFRTVTDFGGVEEAAAVSPDGHFVAFLSDREGQLDVWVTQTGTGQFHNLTRGRAQGLVNPSIRSPGFSPDGSLVTYWDRKEDSGEISVWGVPTLGGEPRPYLEGVAEFDWSPDGSRLAYHTPATGDPMFVSDGMPRPGGRPIFTAPAGLHSHFPLWSRDGDFVYFVQGSLPDKLDIWRISPEGGVPERITSHNARVSHPVFLDRRTLMYLASDADGAGPWLYSTDVERRVPHRLTNGPERYTSLAASSDGRRLVATVSNPKTTLWRLPIADSPANVRAPTSIALTTATGFFPRLGPDFLLYVSANGAGESIWRLANGTSSELWRGEGARVLGPPAISPDGHTLAFSVGQAGQTLLYVMQADGTNTRALTDSLNLQGAPAWASDGRSITSAVVERGVPHLYAIPIDGRSPSRLTGEYSTAPTWAPGGHFAVYSGPDVGTTFSVKAVSEEGAPQALRALTLTRGARHLAFLPGGHRLLFLRGDIQHKDLWTIDLDTGAEEQLTKLPGGFDVRDFDLSPDGREVVLERVEERSNIVLLDLPGR